MAVRKKLGIIFQSALYVLLLSTGLVFSQSFGFQVKVDQIVNQNFPMVEMRMNVLNAQSLPITGLTKENITLREDGNDIVDFSFSTISDDDAPLALAILLDTSGSMKATNASDPLGDAISSATNLINRLKPVDQVAVITFSDSVNVLQELSDNKSQIPAKFSDLKAEGATAMNDAIVNALNLLGNRSERRAIILITDGRPEGDQDYSFENALNLAASRSIPIYPVGFGDLDKIQLAKLAELSGGVEQIQPDSQTLDEAFNKILALFREQYWLQYTSLAPADGEMHQIEVFVTYQGETQSDQISFQARNPILISLANVESGQLLEGTVDLEFAVDALNPISQLEIYVDDVLAQTLTSEPFVYSWDTDSVPAGQHTIRVVAQDTVGNIQESIFAPTVALKQHIGLIWLIAGGVLIVLVAGMALLLRNRSKGEATAMQKAMLVEIEGLQPGHEWQLNKNMIYLGRKIAGNDIRLLGMDASRDHAVIERSRRGYCVRSQKPENPVLVNGEKVEERILQAGDVVQMGESIFRFEQRD